LNIHIIDSQCGSGKTEYAIRYMSSRHEETNFMYITPFLKEVERVKKSVPFVFCEPKEGSKFKNLIHLVSCSAHISSTHALFAMGNDELANLINLNNYELILDEVLSVLEPIGFKKGDMEMLINEGVISVGDDNVVSLTNRGLDLYEKGSEFNNRFDIIKTGRVLMVNGGMMLWRFPVDMLKCFKKVTILTYMFQNQTMYNYLLTNGAKFSFSHLVGYKLCNGKCDYSGEEYSKLIKIYDGKLNDIGEKSNTLSSTWFSRQENKRAIYVVAKNAYNYFRRVAMANSDITLWTTVNSVFTTGLMNINGHKSSFLVMTSRATNDYSHKRVLAYLVNRYENPAIHSYFIKHGISVDNDIFALSELIQWIFRSAIRKNEPIRIYIPSARMRRLLQNWLNGTFEKNKTRRIK